ncbi:inhibitor of growth proteins N-terminal histone-binding-domain-containing protein [Sphaerosporella brunnea]|uniref:Chromatin modification-related protein n=1 Tax=Sphaerosporella brunnea TaxID=1250544 RepID=A0A5J5F5H9_9PEZI|nr:inhibitor of growth proteins N-terminal histone-binding-domain-containing protein [Sphaerosporella brunnea]
MSAPTEDAATVLEIFVNDVANLPAEIHHLYDEMIAKDRILSEHRSIYLTRDASLQKHIRLHGSHAENPKESAYTEQIRKNQRRVLELQDEKLQLAQKALDLIDKHSRRLDAQIANLVREGLMPADALTPAPPPSNLPAASQQVSARATGGISSSPGIAGLARSFGGGADRSGTPGTPAAQVGQNKRLKLTAGGAAVSALGRPATPGLKAETSRAGTPSGHSGTRKTGRNKPPKRVIDEDGDEEEEEEEEENGEADDKRLYCICQQVSYGSMVGCDDKDCPYEWFHWGCVNLTEEPKGKWYCPACTERREKARMR